MYRIVYLMFGVVFLSGCYSFKGTSIDPEINTFFINRFDLELNSRSASAPPTLAFDFTEALKDRIRSQTRLDLVNDRPDIEFSGKVVEYSVEPVAPKAGEVSELNQLWITVSIDYQNNIDGKEDDTWTYRTRQFAEFDNTQDLISVQDALVEEINSRLLDDIINKAFNNW